MQFLITFGFSYQLPLLMWAITISGVVNTTFWKHNIRYFIIIIIIFSAIITPDGSGITMWFVAGPMIFIYIIGIIVIDRSVKLS
jgi:sec-independent protein translocase protein TatC